MSPSNGQVTHALLTRPPLTSEKASFLVGPFDLHVLSTPPAFILSQDQTLMLNSLNLFQKTLAFQKFTLVFVLNFLIQGLNFKTFYFKNFQGCIAVYLSKFCLLRFRNIFATALLEYHFKKYVSILFSTFSVEFHIII